MKGSFLQRSCLSQIVLISTNILLYLFNHTGMLFRLLIIIHSREKKISLIILQGINILPFLDLRDCAGYVFIPLQFHDHRRLIHMQPARSGSPHASPWCGWRSHIPVKPPYSESRHSPVCCRMSDIRDAPAASIHRPSMQM